MDCRDFIKEVLNAFFDNRVWIFCVRGIVMDCSESFLKLAEVERDNFIGRDVIKNPINFTTTDNVRRKSVDPYRFTIIGSKTGIERNIVIVPYQYDDYRFTIITLIEKTWPISSHQTATPETTGLSSTSGESDTTNP